jgi:hypothetical protein
MNLNTVDLYAQLQKEKRRSKEEEILEEVAELLNEAGSRDEELLQRLKGSGTHGPSRAFAYDPGRIYTTEQIKRLCIKYRLRFLDTKYFKGEIPYEALSKVRQLEKESGQVFQAFKIIAPKELFHLSDKDSDPLLFVPIGKDRFYFIHQWGGELNVLRSILAIPLRNFMSMFWFLFALAFLFSLAIPTDSVEVFLFLVVHSFIAICGMACMIVLSLRENFSNTEWDSQYLS